MLRSSTATTDENSMSILVYSSRRVPLHLDHLVTQILWQLSETVLCWEQGAEANSATSNHRETVLPLYSTQAGLVLAVLISRLPVMQWTFFWISLFLIKKCYENVLKLKPCQFATARQVFRSIQFRQGAEREMTQLSSVNDSMGNKEKKIPY